MHKHLIVETQNSTYLFCMVEQKWFRTVTTDVMAPKWAGPYNENVAIEIGKSINLERFEGSLIDKYDPKFITTTLVISMEYK